VRLIFHVPDAKADPARQQQPSIETQHLATPSFLDLFRRQFPKAGSQASSN
jgi:hypothetical protein